MYKETGFFVLPEEWFEKKGRTGDVDVIIKLCIYLS